MPRGGEAAGQAGDEADAHDAAPRGAGAAAARAPRPTPTAAHGDGRDAREHRREDEDPADSERVADRRRRRVVVERVAEEVEVVTDPQRAFERDEHGRGSPHHSHGRQRRRGRCAGRGTAGARRAGTSTIGADAHSAIQPTHAAAGSGCGVVRVDGVRGGGERQQHPECAAQRIQPIGCRGTWASMRAPSSSSGTAGTSARRAARPTSASPAGRPRARSSTTSTSGPRGRAPAGGEHRTRAARGWARQRTAPGTGARRRASAHRPPIPASRAFTIACARSTTWILVKMLETWLRTVLVAARAVGDLRVRAPARDEVEDLALARREVRERRRRRPGRPRRRSRPCAARSPGRTRRRRRPPRGSRAAARSAARP